MVRIVEVILGVVIKNPESQGKKSGYSILKFGGTHCRFLRREETSTSHMDAEDLKDMVEMPVFRDLL